MVITVISYTYLETSALLPQPQPGVLRQGTSSPEMTDSKRPPHSKLEHTMTLTAKGPPGGPWPGWCLSRISLHLASKHQLQLLGIWRRDGIPPNRHLNQREPHAPDVRLHGVMSPLESLWLQERQTITNTCEPTWAHAEEGWSPSVGASGLPAPLRLACTAGAWASPGSADTFHFLLPFSLQSSHVKLILPLTY